jgi:hypothetical protein
MFNDCRSFICPNPRDQFEGISLSRYQLPACSFHFTPSLSPQGCSLTFQKQGILPLWFTDKSDYSLISAHDKVTTSGLSSLLQNGSGEIVLQVTRPSGEKIEIKTSHTMSKDQLEWLRAGSALNYIGEQARVAGRA